MSTIMQVWPFIIAIAVIFIVAVLFFRRRSRIQQNNNLPFPVLGEAISFEEFRTAQSYLTRDEKKLVTKIIRNLDNGLPINPEDLPKAQAAVGRALTRHREDARR